MKFKVGDLVITSVQVEDAFHKGAYGKITHIDKDDEFPYEVKFIAGYLLSDECWAKEEELEACEIVPASELTDARETIAAQQIVIEALQAQVKTYRAQLESRARVIDGEELP